ncbi:MAG: hypothetical protein ACRDVM_06695 [Acidimicrobiia bacterium]
MRVRTHLPLVALGLTLTGVLVWATAAPALANHCSGSGDVWDGGGGARAECQEYVPPTDVEGRQSGCLWEFQHFLSADEATAQGLDPDRGWALYAVFCWVGGETEFVVVPVFVPEAPDPEAVRDEAAARIDLLPPPPQTSPPFDREGIPPIVRDPVFLWLSEAYWQPQKRSDTQGAVSVRVEARPVVARWDMGERNPSGSYVGSPFTCQGPGIPWEWGMRAPEDTYCSYTFTHSSHGQPAVDAFGRAAFEAWVEVRWDFSWWLNGEPQGEFGSVSVRSGFLVPVGEIQALETGG